MNNQSHPYRCVLCGESVDGETHVKLSANNRVCSLCCQCAQSYRFDLHRVRRIQGLKEELLEKYATKEPTSFCQFDVHPFQSDDEIEGSMYWTPVDELMSGMPIVRVLVPTSAAEDKHKVARAIQKVAEWIIEAGVVPPNTRGQECPS